jgi:hypothetical protein
LNDARYAALKDMIEDRIDYWWPRMGLHGWDIVRVWHRDRRDFPVEAHEDHWEMAIVADWEYLNINLHVYLNWFDQYDPRGLPSLADRIDKAVMHELLHVRFAPLREYVKPKLAKHHMRQEELAVSWLTAVLWGVYESGEKAYYRQENRIKRLQSELDKAKGKAEHA